jgi:hypothetical protein
VIKSVATPPHPILKSVCWGERGVWSSEWISQGSPGTLKIAVSNIDTKRAKQLIVSRSEGEGGSSLHIYILNIPTRKNNKFLEKRFLLGILHGKSGPVSRSLYSSRWLDVNLKK